MVLRHVADPVWRAPTINRKAPRLCHILSSKPTDGRLYQCYPYVSGLSHLGLWRCPLHSSVFRSSLRTDNHVMYSKAPQVRAQSAWLSLTKLEACVAVLWLKLRLLKPSHVQVNIPAKSTQHLSHTIPALDCHSRGAVSLHEERLTADSPPRWHGWARPAISVENVYWLLLTLPLRS